MQVRRCKGGKRTWFLDASLWHGIMHDISALKGLPLMAEDGEGLVK